MDHLMVFMLLSQIHIYTNSTTTTRSFSYESLLQDKTAFCREFFKDIGISPEFVDIGLTALKQDSQKNSKLSRSVVGSSKVGVSSEALEWGKKLGREEYGLELGGDTYQVVNMPNQWDK